MTDETQKKPEAVESTRPVERNDRAKIAEVARDSDQVEKFRSIRRELSKTEQVFSVTQIGGKNSGAKFELFDGDTKVAAAKPKSVDLKEAEKDAEAVRKATGNDNYIFRHADRDAINKILEGKTDDERKAIDQIYKRKYGVGLEQEMRGFETGSDLEKFLNILHRQDNNSENGAARRIHEDLTELHNTFEGRSSSQIEKDIRDLLSTRNSEQVTKLAHEYETTYGTSFASDIARDTKVSDATKDMVAIYLKGNDKRTDQDTAQLINIALSQKDTDLFAESMRDASPAARQAFLNKGGEQRVNDAFGHWYSNSAVQHAMEYAREGKLSAATQVRDNTGIVFDNDKGIELAVQRMTDTERKQYLDGKALVEGKTVAGLSADDQQKSRDYYNNLHTALERTANATEMVKYEDMIAGRGDEVRALHDRMAAVTRETPEQTADKLHTLITGWGGSSELVSDLQNVKKEDLDVLKSQYAAKYGTSLEGDLMNKLGGQDRDVVERILTQNLSADERANIARDQTANARSGIGASLSDSVFRSGTGVQADDAQNQTNRAISERNRLTAAIEQNTELVRNMTPEQMQQLQQQVSAQIDKAVQSQNQARDNAVESKKTAARYLADGAIMTAAIGSLIITGGADAPLVIGLAAAGAGIKVGTNAVMEGNNYDFSFGQVATDAGLGSLTAATAVIGPGEIAAVFGVGKAAATEAASIAVTETGEQLLVQGGREALENGTRDIIQNTLASGARKLNPAEFDTLASRVISPELTGEARQQAVQKLAETLQHNVSERLANGIVRQFTHVGLNAAGGGAAGGATGFGESVLQWDSSKTIADNVGNIARETGESALTGAAFGAALSGASSAFGEAVGRFRTPEVEPRLKLNRNWRVNEHGQILDSKGNILERDWPTVREDGIEPVRTQVRTELNQVKASGDVSVLDKLESSGLSTEQKKRVLDSLAEVREHYARTFKVDNDQVVNWIHTQGELGRVLDAAKAAKLSPTETEDALLASMFSDSLKTKANFTTHHLDGELAAEHILGSKLDGNFTQARLDGIMHAIREHQIAPPSFMAMIYSGAIRASIAAEGRLLTEAETADLSSLARKIADPFHQTLVDARNGGGGKILELSDGERALLKRTGADDWYVPSENTPWSKISRALIDGDGIDNYATPGGLSKIIQIRGPETGPFFKDGNFRYENPERAAGAPPNSSQQSWRDSFNDFAKVASPDGLRIAQQASADAERASIAAQERVDAWLHQRLGIPSDQKLPTIPGWTGKPKLNAEGHPMFDGNGRPVMEPDNLKYPDYEPGWWNVHVKPAATRTAEEKAFYENPAHRYRGLNEQEIEQFKLAQEIRDRYAAELRKEQRVKGDAAPDYQPVVRQQ